MRNMQQIMQHLQSAWEHSSYKAGCGSYISLEKALQGQFDVYDGVFTPVDPQDDDSLFLLRPAGRICADTVLAAGTSCPSCTPACLRMHKNTTLPSPEIATKSGSTSLPSHALRSMLPASLF